MRSFIVVAFLIICVATVTFAGNSAQLVGSVQAVYHEGVVTFQVSHNEAVSSSVRVYDLESDALIYDSGPRAQTLVTWPAGHDAPGSYRYVVTAWNADGQVVVSQTAATKGVTEIAVIPFDTVPANTKFLGPNEIIMENDLQIGNPQRARITDNLTHGGDFDLYEEDGLTTHFWIEPDVGGEGAFVLIDGSAASGSEFVLQGMGSGGEADYAQTGTSDFFFRSGSTGDASMVLPANAVSSTEMANEPGVAAALSGTSVTVGSTPASVLLRSLTAPAAGYVLAIATVDMQIVHGAGGSNFSSCGISLSSTTIPSDGDQSVQVAPAAPAGVYNFAISMNRVFSVAAGTDTYYVVCDTGTGDAVTAFDRHLDLVYLPTAYGAVSTESELGDGDMENVDGYISPNQPATQAEIEAERADAIAGNLARIQAELAAIKAQTDVLEAELTNEQ